MRWLLATCLLCGCTPEVQDYVPLIAICAGMDGKVPDQPDEPDEPDGPETCQTCDGAGYLGDGTIKVDCPDCDVDWQQPAFGSTSGVLIEVYSRHQEPIDAYWLDHEELTLGEATVLWLESQLPKGTPTQELEEPEVVEDGPWKWFTSVREARAYGESKDMPVLQFFTQDGCAPCRQWEQSVSEGAGLDALQEFAAVRVKWSPTYREYFSAYGINSTPMLVVEYDGKRYFQGPPMLDPMRVAVQLTDIHRACKPNK